MSRTRDLFAAVHSEGNLLPPDLLQRLMDRDKALPGLAPADYHHDGERLNELAAASWLRLQGRWLAFQEARAKLPVDDPGTTVTRERWLLPLFQELDYGRLQTAKAVELGGRSYAVSHAWPPAPIHLVGCNVALDQKTAGVAGAARTSPHSLVQELLNRSDDHLWAFVSNGLRLRLLRDNVSLSRQAYVELDLEAMMEGELYSDFVLLWLLCHQSRVEGERPEECWLEKWSQEAQRQGVRALDGLRKGVERAISSLGSGFLKQAGNQELLEKLRDGRLDKQDYYRQLLRMVYRLLFLFTAEDRGLLLDPAASEAAAQTYAAYYSAERLRHLAERRRGSRHTDLFESLHLVMQKLGGDGCPELGLPPLGSMLFADESVVDLLGCRLANRDLLEAVRNLAFTSDRRSLRPIDFRNLGAEELGSVYESLLEMQPDLNREAATFALRVVSGSERKTTGSYSTPSSLTQCLLDTALDPVIDERLKAAATGERERALLDLKICDPACGCGHILIGAAHRLARRLAAVRTGDDEPSPQAMRQALRDVISHCIYGVDINPMAVELCKVNLWMEALEPGKPLSFLDHHIQCGNSLLGATPALLREGIPDAAFTAIEGDDKKVCTELRKQNKKERAGQTSLFGRAQEPWERLGALASGMMDLDDIDDATPEGVREKQARYERVVRSSDYLYGKLFADAWCAAFVQPKTRETTYPITEEVFRRIEENPHGVPVWLPEEVQRLATRYRFFHWHLQFPDVFRVPASDRSAENEQTGWNGGFDVVVGNPPWDTLSPDAKEFFSSFDPQVRHVDKVRQAAIIEELLTSPDIESVWRTTRRDLFAGAHFMKDSGRYRLFAEGNLGKGDFNVFRMFIEIALQTARDGGFVAQLVPEGIYNGANCAAIRAALFSECSLRELLGFENAREVWFKGIDSRTKFALYAARLGGDTTRFHASFNIRTLAALNEARRMGGLSIPTSMVREFSPDALAIMELADQRDIDVATKMYARWPKFGDESAGSPMRTYMRELGMGNENGVFGSGRNGLPLYEGRMVGQFDHRAKGYRSGRGRSAVWQDLTFGSSEKSIQPQWRVSPEDVPGKARGRTARFRTGFCDVASPTNERSLVAALIPAGVLAGEKVPTILFEDGWDWANMLWLAVANSFAMDFLARKKVALKMSYTLVDSLPFPRVDRDHPLARRLVPLALALSCCGPEMDDYWDARMPEGWVASAGTTGGTPVGVVDEDLRLELRAQIDAIVARDAFGLSADEMDFILDTFPIVRQREQAKYGEYRSKRLILEEYERTSG